MRGLMTVCVMVALLSGIALKAAAQNRSPELIEVTQIIEREVRGKMPEWRRQAAVPMTAGETVTDKVAVDYWTDGVSILKVSIISHGSEKEAFEAMNRYPDTKGRGKVEEGLGDEAATLNGNEIIAFRRHNLMIYVVEIGEFRFKGESALGKQFAHRIAAALKLLDKSTKSSAN